MPEKTFFRKALALSVLAFLRKNLWDTCDEVSPHLPFHANGQWAKLTCSEAIVAPHKYPFVRLSPASVASRFTEPRRRARRYMVAGGGAATAAQPPVSRKNKQNPAVWRGGIMCGFNLLRCFIPPSAKVSLCTRLFCHRRFQRGSHNHVLRTEVSLGKLAPPPPKSLVALTGAEIFLANTLSGSGREVSPCARRRT